MKRLKKNRFNGYYVIICIVAILLIVLCGALVIHKTNEDNTLYKSYDNHFIKVRNDTSFSYQANLVHDEYLAILVTSTTTKGSNIKADVTFYNSDNKEVFADEMTNFMSSEGQTVFTFSIPDLGNDYAGKIDIHLSELEENIDDMVDFGGVNYQESHSLDENHNTVFSIEGINETEYYFRNIIGNVVALRDGNIVCVDSFVVSDVAVGATFSTVAHFPADFSNGQLQAMKFDEVLIFSTYVDVT